MYSVCGLNSTVFIVFFSPLFWYYSAEATQNIKGFWLYTTIASNIALQETYYWTKALLNQRYFSRFRTGKPTEFESIE